MKATVQIRILGMLRPITDARQNRPFSTRMLLHEAPQALLRPYQLAKLIVDIATYSGAQPNRGERAIKGSFRRTLAETGGGLGRTFRETSP